MGAHLVLVGGGHAHLATLKGIGDYVSRAHRVTLINPSTHHYYSGMGPGLLSGIYRPQEVRFNVGKMVERGGGTFIESRVTGIDPVNRALILADGRTVTYDIASFNLGSEVVPVLRQRSHVGQENTPPTPLEGGIREGCALRNMADRALDGFVPTPERVFPVKPIINLLTARRSILDHSRDRGIEIVIIGGGPAGIELAGNAWRLANEHRITARISLISGGAILEQSPARARQFVLESFALRGIGVREHVRMVAMESGHVSLSDGTDAPYDVAFLASGIRPPEIFRESGLPVTEDGSLMVDKDLRCVGSPTLFGGGDCVGVDGYRLAKVGVHAVGQSRVLRHNLLAALEGRSMRPFIPKEHYMLILNLGDGRGILCKRGGVFRGRWAYLLKDYVDRRFMRAFQVSGERTEP